MFMAKGPSGRARAAALFFLCCAALFWSPAQAEGVVAESAGDALARNVRVLGTSPRDFDALIGAGRAALAMGDTQAAAGFFGRADEVWPASPLPQAGIGAALAQQDDPSGALSLFDRAIQRGATQSMIGSDRGLAYDLLGRHAEAQADYRAALGGRDGDEARRRLALSLAITGNKAEALSTLGPLMARGDAGGARCRAFVLALTGDPTGARAAIEAAMPGSASQMDYFFRKLPSLRSNQKVAAVNLGIFPGSGQQVASATPSPFSGINSVKVIQVHSTPPPPRDNRVESIESWLKQSKAATAEAPPEVTSPPSATQVASVSLPPQVAHQATSITPATNNKPKLWLELASGTDAATMPAEFGKLKRRDRELFDGISGYVAEDGAKARLVIGPFRNSQEAGIFADDLASVHIDAFTWTSQPGQTIRKLPSE
jgi:Flp pilus assembly protein TadD